MFVVEKKRLEGKEIVVNKCGCKIGCIKCVAARKFIDQMADANIPFAYWDLSYAKFSGSKNIKNATVKYIKDLKKNFESGTSIAYAGTPGTGKTFSACTILRSALAMGYEAYYTTLSDMIFYLTDFGYKDKFYHTISRTDILCIDEVDSRHYAESETSEGFFGRTFERIVRYRIQNKLPIILLTNNSKIDEAFAGQFKKIVESLSAANTIVVPSLGPDYRLK